VFLPLIFLLCSLIASPIYALTATELNLTVIQQIFPDANRVGTPPAGTIALPVLHDTELLGYAIETDRGIRILVNQSMPY